ncbi:BatD family protein [Hyalangium rubrum]|uniref:BatD family protein n=1 Tax=Hyalangium rubrum TaxID=3103134 RepID=A0ABU5H5R6_9BACT|nr:BatD family protein [Hyalangium sp. s54d21]MDY7228601.1 BatD family protein [Hyalangium sp. s54d21]
MRRTGSGRTAVLAVLALLAASPAWAEIEFYQSVDRTEVGTEDTFRLTVVAVDAPPSAQVQLPAPKDFEVLSSSRGSQRSIQLSGGGPAVIQDITKHTLLMRASRPGKLTIPPAVLTTASRTYRTESIEMTVREGRMGPPPGQQGQATRPQLPDPFRNFPMPDPFEELEDSPTIPRGDSDLFLRASLDRNDVYVGEQTTLSLYIYSRVDLSSVDAVTMPKLEGFWSEEVESPTQLSGEQKVINGIPYRAYLLRRRALFPVKSGTLTITAAEADITTGFLFAGHRVHRVSNVLKVKVKPLPPGAPPGMANAHVGDWHLSMDVSPTRVELGQPVTVKIILEGTGNVKNVSPPKLNAPQSLKVYDPTTTDRVSPSKNRIQGKRVQEYLVMPQRTGTFTLPGLEFPYFDPRRREYDVARTDAVTITVEAGSGAVAQQGPTPTPMQDSANEQKNVLTAGGLRPLRYQARFVAPSTPVWQRAFFLPAVLAPVGLLFGAVLLGQVRGRLFAQTEAGRNKQQAKAARKRLAEAEKLRGQGSSTAFYAEVEKALNAFLEARLATPVVGLTREALGEKMAAANVEPARRSRVLFVLEACDMGRFGGGAELSERERILNEAAAVMEGWEK